MPLTVAENVVAIPLRPDPHVHVNVPADVTRVRISTPVDLYVRIGSEPAEPNLAARNDGLAAARLQANGEHVREVVPGQVLTFVAETDPRLATIEFFPA